MANSILKINDLNAYYDKSHVLQGVSLDIKPLERVAVLGRNGMGKTTFLKSILGFPGIRCEGQILLGGKNIIKKKTYEIVKTGSIAYLPQGKQLFQSLSVEEHMVMSYRPAKVNEWTPERIFDFFPELAARRKVKGTSLSGGEQQFLALGRALVLNSRLILMDEPSEGVSSMIVEKIIALCHQLTKEKVTLLLVEQNLDMALRIAERVCIFVNGRVVHQASTLDFSSDKDNQQKYLGIG